MKISELLAELKQKEGELMRNYNLRDSVIKQSFTECVHIKDNISTKEFDQKQKEFLKNKRKRVESINARINELKTQIVEGRNKINKRNIKIGLDKQLIEMKYLRLELSKLMNLIRKERFGIGEGIRINVDIYDELGISERISELEHKKAKLDAEIQKFNWATNV